jgi:cytochrome b involved in lipid metabolism
VSPLSPPVAARLISRVAFVDEHPGGSKILKRVAGKDATKQFWKYHNESVLKKYGARLQIGTVKDVAKL